MTDLRKRMIDDMTLNGLSPGTQKAYIDAVKALAGHYNICPDKLTEPQIREYLLYLAEIRKLAKSTLNVHVCAIRFLYQKTLYRPWPVLTLVRIRQDKKLPTVLSRDEVWELLNLVRRETARVSLLLMYTCGLRVSEATRLRKEDIDSRRMVVMVRNAKGSKDRYVPLPDYTLQQLRSYWQKTHPQDFLFPDHNGRQPIKGYAVRRCLKAAQLQTTIRKQVGCHTLRHSYATHLLEKGVDLRVIQGLLGHKSLKTTFIYLHLTQATMVPVRAKIDELMRCQ